VEDRPLEDTRLIELTENGDVEAFGGLIRRYQQDAFRLAYLITRNNAEAEDAAQDAFLKAYRALGSFRAGGSFRAWLLAIVANEARNRLRSSSRRTTLETRSAAERSSPDPAPSPEGAFLAEEERAALALALARLPEADRTVIAYRYFLHLSESEMAETLGCARGTVKSRLSRALVKLRGVLAQSATTGGGREE